MMQIATLTACSKL